MHKLAAGLLTVIGFLLCFAAAAPARAAFNMERCMAKVEARGLTARRAAFVCHRNSQGKMYRRTPGTATSKGSHTPQR
jgi:Skp family chaperone for outer membrane proteins